MTIFEDRRGFAVVVGLAMIVFVNLLGTEPVAAQASSSRIKLATTTSTEASGLLGVLLPQFEKRTGIKVDVISVGTGQALKLASRGDVDVVLVHSRPDEDKYMADGFGTVRRDVMYNDFVIVGDKSDPAGIARTRTAAAALTAIAAEGAKSGSPTSRFISRGDDSGTHKRELQLWREAGIDPLPGKGKWYLESGQGMGETLTIAGNMRAYTLTDRGTFLAHRGRVGLHLLVTQVPGLYNPYGVMDVNPAKHPHVKQREARQFIDWLVSPEGVAAIKSLQVNGVALFTPGAPPKE